MDKPKMSIPLTERLKSIPGFFGIHLDEQLKYTVLKAEKKEDKEKGDSHLEFREYQPHLVARTTVHGQYEDAKEEAFMKLANYIFSHDIAMTTPVFFETRGDAITMSFVLPSEMKAQSMPLPDDSTVHILEVPAQTWAVVRYSGKNELKDVEEKTALLEEWLHSSQHTLDKETLRMAQYDGPNTIPFLRTNEVQARLWSGDLKH